MHKFEKLEVWQRSMSFISEIYRVTATFPKQEMFGLIDQLRRAATAIALNIAEGSGAGTDLEFMRFLRISLRSVYEVITALKVADNLNYGNENEINKLLNEADEIGAMISGLINSIKRKSSV